MDSDGWPKAILLIVLLLAAAYCASAEITFASLNKIRAKNLADKGDKRAIKALYVTDNFDKALTTLLIGNNITHIGFASLVTLIATQTWGTSSVIYATVFSTIVVFLFSEMIPKSYGKSNLDYALRISGSLTMLIKVFEPLSRFFTFISDSVSKLFKISEDEEMSQEDFYEIMRSVNENGSIDKTKRVLVYSALDFDLTKVKDVFTPLEDVESINIESSPKDILKQLRETRYSRLPVYRQTKDNIIGVLQTKQFLKAYIKKDLTDIKSLLLEPSFVTPSVLIDDLLRKMSSEKNHIFIVKNNKDKVEGIITMEDILEELVGEIWDENDVVKGDVL
ncbi:MAG TPA: hemolysin family protein [Bacillota bacterium]|nr:hemolysin family protein [Bacillota bacterium]